MCAASRDTETGRIATVVLKYRITGAGGSEGVRLSCASLLIIQDYSGKPSCFTVSASNPQHAGKT
jgi:hypothetical protein